MSSLSDGLSLERIQCGVSRNAKVLLALPKVLVPLAQGKPLIASSILPAINIIDSIARSNIKNLSIGTNSAADYYYVLKRMQEVLILSEKRTQSLHTGQPERILVKELSTSWNL